MIGCRYLKICKVKLRIRKKCSVFSYCLLDGQYVDFIYKTHSLNLQLTQPSPNSQ
jgi:hypothetical protein